MSSTDMEMVDNDNEIDPTPTSGYSSDASTFSIESHASQYQSIENMLYTTEVNDSNIEEEELMRVDNEIPNRINASPLQLRAGAPLPHRMYGLSTPKSHSGTPLGRSQSRADSS